MKVHVQLETRKLDIEFDGKPHESIEAGLVTDIRIGDRARFGRKVLGFVTLDTYSETYVDLEEDAAERMVGLYDQLYRHKDGQVDTIDDEPVVDCHAFVSHFAGFNPRMELRLPTLCNELVFGAVPPDQLENGQSYGIFRDPIEDSDNPSEHSMIAVGRGDSNLSVVSTNGPLAVTDNYEILRAYDGTRIAPLDGHGYEQGFVSG